MINEINTRGITTHSFIKKIETGQSLARFVERTGLIEREFITLVNKLRDRQGEVTNGIKLLAKKANGLRPFATAVWLED